MARTAPETTAELDEMLSKPSEAVVEAVRELPGSFAVLGAGGKMGFHFSRMLQRSLQILGRGDLVVAASRFGDHEKRRQFESAGLHVVCADMTAADQVATLPDAENVFFLAGIKFGTSGNPDVLWRMNEHMPRLVAKRYMKSRIVALSTGCVYEFVTPESGGSTEASGTNPPGEYAESCLGREQAFIENADEHGTLTTLIRLNYANECRYGVLVDIGTKVQTDQPISLSMGYVNLIWQRDAVDHIIRSMLHATAPPCVLNITGPGIWSVQELAEMFGQRLGKSPRYCDQPQDTAWLNNASRSHQLLGAPEFSVEDMVDCVAEWLRQGGDLLGKPTHFEARDGEY